MREYFKTDSKWAHWFILALFAALVSFVTYHTVWIADDLIYSFYLDKGNALFFNKNHLFIAVPFTHVWQLFPSQWNHYLYVNGRYPAHFLVQLFCGFLGKGAFSIANGAVFALFVGLMVRVADYRLSEWRAVLVTAIAGYLFLLILPVPSFCIGYVWMSCLCLGFLLFLRQKDLATLAGWKYVLIGLFAFIAGWSNEAISTGLSGALLISMLLNWKQWNRRQLGLLFLFGTGTLVLLLAPGNFVRVGSLAHHSSMWETVPRSFQKMLPHFRLFYVLLCALPFLWRRWNRTTFFYSVAIGTSLAFVFVVRYINERQLYGIELFSLILLLQGAKQIPLRLKNITKRGMPLLLTVMVGYTAWHAFGLIGTVLHIEQDFSELVGKYQKSTDGTVHQALYPIPPRYYPYVMPLTWLSPNKYATRFAVYYAGASDFKPLQLHTILRPVQ